MHLKLSTFKKAKILGIKINEIDLSEEYTQRDKNRMMDFYKKKLQKLYPNQTI